MKFRLLPLVLIAVFPYAALAQINYETTLTTLTVYPYSRIPPNSRLLPGSFTTDATSLFGCLTEDMSEDEFYAQPWIGDDQYLTNYLQTFGLPTPPGPQARVEEYEQTVKYRIPVKFWEYKSSSTAPNMAMWQYQRYMDDLNRAHRAANTGMRFFIIDDITVTVDNSLTSMSGLEQVSNWTSGRNQAFAINVHVVDNVKGAGGRTVFVPSRACMIEKLYGPSNPTSSFVHEVGHYLGLIHTHFGGNYRGPAENCFVEPVDHSRRFNNLTLCHGFGAGGKRRCAFAGDGLCDTPADPQMDGNQVNNCLFTDGNPTDIFGDHYANPPSGSSAPDPTNIMSYGDHECRTNFTPEQTAVMLHSIKSVLGGNHSNDNRWGDESVAFDTFEPDFTPDMARLLTLNVGQVHTFHRQVPGGAAGDVDWMYFEVPASENGTQFTVKTQHGSVFLDDANTKITLYNATRGDGVTVLGSQIASNSTFNGDPFARLSAVLSTGFYAVKLENESFGLFPGSYYITVFNCMDPDTFSVTGESNICNSGSFVFTATGIPSGVSATWSVSSGVQILSSSATTITVKGNSTSSSGWVKATVCSIAQNASKDFSIGVLPNSELGIQGSSTVCSNSMATYRAVQAPTGYGYHWNYPTSNGWSYVSGQGSINLTLTSGTTGAAVSYYLTSNCGNSTASSPFQTQVTCTGGGSGPPGGHYLLAYPNPADDQLNVTLPEDSANITVDESKFTRHSKPNITGYEVVVYDVLQREVFRTRTAGNSTVNIPTGHLPEGVYYLNIINREGVNQRQIEIRRR